MTTNKRQTQRIYVGVRGQANLSLLPEQIKLGTPSHSNPQLAVIVWEGDQAHLLRLDPASSILGTSSSNGLEWGFTGQGPRHLAASILLDHTGDEQITQEYYPEFHSQIIADLPRERFELSSIEIEGFLSAVAR